MSLAELQAQLRATGAYESAPGRRRLRVDRRLGRWSAWYHQKVLRVVLAANRSVRRGTYDAPAWAGSSYRTLLAIEDCGGGVSVAGLLARARREGPVVYVSNHMSMLESFLLPCILLSFGDLAPVVKEDLLRYPLFGAVLRSVHPIAVGRDNPREDLRAVMENGVQAVAAGRSVLVFPQSSRRPYFDVNEFNTLGVKLARQAGAPLVPLALKTDFQGIGRWLRDFGRVDVSRRVRFHFGDPLCVSGNGRAEHQAVIEFIVRNLSEWRVPVVGWQGAASAAAPKQEDNR